MTLLLIDRDANKYLLDHLSRIFTLRNPRHRYQNQIRGNLVAAP